MLPAPLVALLACAYAAEVYKRDDVTNHNGRSSRALGINESHRGCLYDGRWYTESAVVVTREACLRCVCARGALTCSRRACAPLPDPPPRRCYVLHRRGSCCPELHCPDGVTTMEQGASARFEPDDYSDIATPTSISHACVEGGAVYAAGSAMSSSTACEQCFCLGGARRCVRPTCLPPAPGCRPRPAPGACCPQRYYCEHATTSPPNIRHPHDCQVDNIWVGEGERVTSVEAVKNCTQCFCLRGVVQCSALTCAPPLLGCTPVLKPGHCCPHQYRCTHGSTQSRHPYITDNSLISTRNEDRSFHTSKSNKHETTTKTVSSAATKKNSPTTSPVNKLPTTTKVKRKTNESPTLSISTNRSFENITTTSTSTEKLSTLSENIISEGSVKIVINGTINCTAELSSTSLPLNFTVNDAERIESEAKPRVPNVAEIEAQTFNPNDIITTGDFDENDTFTINVTSSLRTNTSTSSPRPSTSVSTQAKTKITNITAAVNITKKTKGDYDYDYTEPTLPPSLPNLKIIPFVAADAVVEDGPVKDTPTYPMLEREDKYPVYYPNVEKETPYATRREDVYPTQYPVFTTKKQPQNYPALTEKVVLPNISYPKSDLIAALLHEYTVSTSIGKGRNEVTKPPETGSTFYMETPSVNLFSPPVETEGGFIPKGPGIMDEFYDVYPSTPSGPPHLTTSMQLDNKGECTTTDGRRVSEGDSVSMACSVCTCAWGELHCSPRVCNTPPGCVRRPASNSAADICCGELVCEEGNKTSTTSSLITTTERIEMVVNEIKIPIKNRSEIRTEQPPQKHTPVPIETLDKVTDKNLPDISHNIEAITFVSVSNKTDINKVLVTSTILPLNVTSKLSTIPPIVTTTTITPDNNKVNESVHLEDYEEEEEEDEGFSFGSVLKLLLSDSYETTSTTLRRKTITTPIPISTTTRPASTTKRLPKPVIGPFVPMPPKKTLTPNAVNRIDHLVLGEATPIKTTPHSTISHRPTISFKPMSKPSTQRPLITRPTTKRVEESNQFIPAQELPRPTSSTLLGVGPGLLKLAGCNIYGRMYRVGRIIAELSTPCLECRCTDVGVQCTSLNC